MEAKGNIYMPKMRVEKTHTVHDDIRVIVAGLLICALFIVIPVYLMQKFQSSETTTIQPKD